MHWPGPWQLPKRPRQAICLAGPAWALFKEDPLGFAMVAHMDGGALEIRVVLFEGLGK